MQRAIRAVIEMGGGLAAVDGDTVLATLALPVAGLMSEAPIEEVRRDYDALTPPRARWAAPCTIPLWR